MLQNYVFSRKRAKKNIKCFILVSSFWFLVFSFWFLVPGLYFPYAIPRASSQFSMGVLVFITTLFCLPTEEDVAGGKTLFLFTNG